MSLLSIFGALAAAAAAPAPQKHFVVLNGAGANFAQLRERPEMIAKHRAVYDEFARRCLTLAGGRLAGDTPLGITIFAVGVDESEIKKAVESDPAVREGFTTVEYRVFEVQRGALPERRTDCTPTEK